MLYIALPLYRLFLSSIGSVQRLFVFCHSLRHRPVAHVGGILLLYNIINYTPVIHYKVKLMLYSTHI